MNDGWLTVWQLEGLGPNGDLLAAASGNVVQMGDLGRSNQTGLQWSG
jgi:hypothetical protein